MEAGSPGEVSSSTGVAGMEVIIHSVPPATPGMSAMVDSTVDDDETAEDRLSPTSDAEEDMVSSSSSSYRHHVMSSAQRSIPSEPGPSEDGYSGPSGVDVGRASTSRAVAEEPQMSAHQTDEEDEPVQDFSMYGYVTEVQGHPDDSLDADFRHAEVHTSVSSHLAWVHECERQSHLNAELRRPSSVCVAEQEELRCDQGEIPEIQHVPEREFEDELGSYNLHERFHGEDLDDDEQEVLSFGDHDRLFQVEDRGDESLDLEGDGSLIDPDGDESLMELELSDVTPPVEQIYDDNGALILSRNTQLLAAGDSDDILLEMAEQEVHTEETDLLVTEAASGVDLSIERSSSALLHDDLLSLDEARRAEELFHYGADLRGHEDSLTQMRQHAAEVASYQRRRQEPGGSREHQPLLPEPRSRRQRAWRRSQSPLGVDASSLEADGGAEQVETAPATGEDASQPALSPELWCEHCCSWHAAGRCEDHGVSVITDRRPQSRAWASLPSSYLCIKPLLESTHTSPERVSPSPVAGWTVVAVRPIPRCTRFGPMEGILVRGERASAVVGSRALGYAGLVLSVETGGQLHTVDVSNPDCSNWMRFVRPAAATSEQNLLLSQQGGHLYFTSCRDVAPGHQLRVGYSPAYAGRRGLPLLTSHAAAAASVDASESCASCGEFAESCACHQPSGLATAMKRAESSILVVDPEDGGRQSSRPEGEVRTLASLSATHDRSWTQARPSSSREAGAAARSTAADRTGKRPPVHRWRCRHCELSFASAAALHHHQVAHTAAVAAPPSTVGDSGAATQQQPPGGATRQLNRAASRPAACSVCAEEFASEEALVDHVALSSHGTAHAPQLSRRAGRLENGLPQLECIKSKAAPETLDRPKPAALDPDRTVACGTCNRRFSTIASMLSHRRVHEAAHKRYICPICRLSCLTIGMLREHVRTHAVGGRYPCPRCHKSFDTYLAARKHIRSFHGDRVFTCHLCHKQTSSPDKLKQHMVIHSDKHEFLCAQCGRQFKRKDKLREHVQRMHSAERLAAQRQLEERRRLQQQPVPATDYQRFVYKCHMCQLGFKRRGMLVNHLARRHPDTRPDHVAELTLPLLRTARLFFCPLCDKNYRSAAKRKTHVLRHHPGAALPASTRGARLPAGQADHAPSLSRAIASVAAAPHPCRWCHKQYASRAKLLQHHRAQHRDQLASLAQQRGGDGADGEPPPQQLRHSNAELDMDSSNSCLDDVAPCSVMDRSADLEPTAAAVSRPMEPGADVQLGRTEPAVLVRRNECESMIALEHRDVKQEDIEECEEMERGAVAERYTLEPGGVAVRSTMEPGAASDDVQAVEPAVVETLGERSS